MNNNTMIGTLAIIYALAILALSPVEQQTGLQQGDEESPSTLQIVPCDEESLELPDEIKTALMSVKITQCMMPFGALVVAETGIPASFVQKTGNILAEMLDQDMDGEIDDANLLPFVQDWGMAFVVLFMDENEWVEESYPALEQQGLGYDMAIKNEWLEIRNEDAPNKEQIQIIVEEVVHYLTQFGYSMAYPEIFGVDEWGSVIAQETLRAACDWWQHPENDCPDNPKEIEEGDCSGPSCDVAEFYHQVLMMRVGMQPGWLGIGFPSSREELEEKLSDEIKDVLDDPQYHQLQNPLTFEYQVGGH